MKTRIIGVAIIVLSTTFSCSNSKKGTIQDELPNIVLLMGDDPGETINLADDFPEIAKDMQTELRIWQESLLNSLMGADYN